MGDSDNNSSRFSLLSCKEELENSDMENSTNDENKEEIKPQKKKRRRRDVDLIKMSDDDEDDSDEEVVRKKHVRGSPGLNSPSSHREPRTCVLKASQKRRPMSRLLEQLLRNLEKKDPNQFFAWPVNDNFAPGYSDIIRRPMDFSTMKQKIDDNEYRSLNCFISDFKLMCNNAMKYNKAGTVYHKAARRLLHAGLRQLAPHKLRPLGNILTYMYEIPIRELGFDIGKMDVHRVKRHSSPAKADPEADEADEAGGEAGSEAGGEDAGTERRRRMERARELHRRRLAKKAFPRMGRDGKTTLTIATRAGDGLGTLGQALGPPRHATALQTPREDRRNLVKGVKPLDYGPFCSFAPTHDSTFATLTRHESHLLYHVYPSETGQSESPPPRFDDESPWRLLYDMDELFPERRAAAPPDAEPESAPPPIDIAALRSLSALGVDTDFLADIEEDVAAAQRDYGLAPALAAARRLLRQLHRAQHDRLSAGPAAAGAGAAGAAAAERAAAAACVRALGGMARRVPPRALACPRALRAAMGVTLDHLDTPMSVDEVEPDGRDASDRDSRSSYDK